MHDINCPNGIQLFFTNNVDEEAVKFLINIYFGPLFAMFGPATGDKHILFFGPKLRQHITKRIQTSIYHCDITFRHLPNLLITAP